jgi:hypothetical protein
MKNLFLIALIVLGFSAVSFGQDVATATSSATIVAPISIANAGDMNFGNVAVQSGTGGTVILAPAGGRTTGGAGGVTLPAFDNGTVSAAHFDVAGAIGYTYSITLPTLPLDVTFGVNTMTVTDFTSTPSAIGTLDGNGEQTIDVGATLNVAAGQAPGLYESDPFTVTVNYN